MRHSRRVPVDRRSNGEHPYVYRRLAVKTLHGTQTSTDTSCQDEYELRRTVQLVRPVVENNLRAHCHEETNINERYSSRSSKEPFFQEWDVALNLS